MITTLHSKGYHADARVIKRVEQTKGCLFTTRRGCGTDLISINARKN